MSEKIQSEKTPPKMTQTLFEKVLVKHKVLSADKYQKAVVKQAHSSANNCYQQAIQEQENIHQAAYQHGYKDGVKQLLNDFIAGLIASEKMYQQLVNQSENQLEQVLLELFNDARIPEIVAQYFVDQQAKLSPINLHIPADLQPLRVNENAEINIFTSTNDTIALEVDNEIYYFSPQIAAKNTLPHIFSVPVRCQILEQRKKTYQKLIDLMALEQDKNEYINE